MIGIYLESGVKLTVVPVNRRGNPTDSLQVQLKNSSKKSVWHYSLDRPYVGYEILDKRILGHERVRIINHLQPAIPTPIELKSGHVALGSFRTGSFFESLQSGRYVCHIRYDEGSGTSERKSEGRPVMETIGSLVATPILLVTKKSGVISVTLLSVRDRKREKQFLSGS
ncbi:MAG: hypothetical protein ABL949_16580 [Fimbriimonadaceae bacterium]